MKQNQITERYFDLNPLTPERMAEIIPEIERETKVVISKELWRGTIYGGEKVGSIAYDAKLFTIPVVCKVFAIKQNVEEALILRNFSVQNRSNLIYVPRVYWNQAWNSERKYGCLITKKVEGEKIFTPPYATEDQMKEYCKFLDEYKLKAITAPWMSKPKIPTWVYMAGRVWKWSRICKDKRMLSKEEYLPQMRRFYKFMFKNFRAINRIPMMFGHGHLGPNEIVKSPDGSYVLMSNMMWGYRPEWYEAAFLIWTCLLAVRDTSMTANDAYGEIIVPWMNHLKKMRCAEGDPFFFQKVGILLIERFIGAILVDIGSHDDFKERDKDYFTHLLGMFQGLLRIYTNSLPPWLARLS